MIAIPAVDLRDGACVQLVGGSYEEERVRLPEPLAVARDWEDAGFRRLHVVDLDAATGKGSNEQVVESLVRDFGGSVQVGGGVRSMERIDQLLDIGVEHVIVGTRAIEEPEWLADAATAHPGRIIVAADVRERRVVTRGWSRTLGLDIDDLVRDLSTLPLAGILVTAVHLEGQMRGTDLALFEDIAEAAAFPVIASGGVTTTADLRALEHRGVGAAVIGMALYTGVLDPRTTALEFGGGA
jgi:phosphoribosylformimino-5-aminoimidazole carboxamide ribotide isomerase